MEKETSPESPPEKRTEKTLTFFNVLLISLGSTLGSGFLLLPGPLFETAGYSAIWAFVAAAIFIIPPVLCILELSTAMPRNGGVYFFIDRSLGPYFGTIGGFGVWIVLILKVAFALIGISLFTQSVLPDFSPQSIAISLAIFFGSMNLFGVKKINFLQLLFLALVISILLYFFVGYLDVFYRIPSDQLFDSDSESFFAAISIAYVSFIGVAKVSSVSAEIKRPEVNLPAAIFCSLFISLLLAILLISWTFGILSPDQITGNLVAVMDAAEKVLGEAGKYLMMLVAVMAFFSAANAGILNASRFPEAMSKDNHMPEIFASKLKNGMPDKSIYLTMLMVILCILLLNPLSIAKLATGFQMLVFVGVCAGLILMRESRIDSYDPGFKVPFYPWIPYAGIMISFYVLLNLGWQSILFVSAVCLFGSVWYRNYSKKHVERQGAIYHIFERLGKSRYEGLDSELREILKEKGLRSKDPFETLVTEAKFIDSKWDDFEAITRKAGKHFEKICGVDPNRFFEEIMDGTRMGSTPVSAGVALPHVRLAKIETPFLLLVRSRNGITIKHNDESLLNRKSSSVRAIFFLVSPKEDANLHLRILAQLAEIVDHPGFSESWSQAKNIKEIKEVLYREQRYFNFKISENCLSESLIGKPIKDAELPPEVLVALVKRGRRVMIPSGSLILEKEDVLTVIGEPKGISALKKKYTQFRKKLTDKFGDPDETPDSDKNSSGGKPKDS